MNRIQGDSQEFLTAILVALEATNDPNLGLSVIPKFTAVHHPGVEKTTGPVQMPVIVLKGVNKRGQTSFQWCLDRLLKNERLGRDEANVEFEDDRISDRANRRDFLCAPEGRVPGTLLFNMPRYRYYKARNRRYKIEVTIAGVEGEHRVPISDRDGNLVGHAIYETVAASCHSGTTHGGHYKAIIKGADGEWEMRNDEAVTKISDREATNLLQNNSYVIRDRLIRYEPIGQA
jgi:ubiquitin C-terminal hydrolase